MGIREVCSPVSRPGSKVGSVSGQPLSPGARSSPGRVDAAASTRTLPSRARVSLGEENQGASVEIVGPRGANNSPPPEEPEAPKAEE